MLLTRRTEIARRDDVVGTHSSCGHEAYGVESGFLVEPDPLVRQFHHLFLREGGVAAKDRLPSCF